jgi:hypothetical protein
MYPFFQSNPVLQSYFGSQLVFLNDLSGSWLGTVQSACDANVKLGETMLEQTLGTGQRIMTSANADDLLGAVAGSAGPISCKLQAYERHVSTLAADAQLDLAHVVQRYGRQASRSARAPLDNEEPQNAGDGQGSGMQPERRMQPERVGKTLQGDRPAV